MINGCYVIQLIEPQEKRGYLYFFLYTSRPNTCCGGSVGPSQDETILLSAHKSVWSDGMVSERNVP